MRKTRKILSFVLILALIMGSFSMVFAADSQTATLSDIAGLLGEDAIEVCQNLGIIEGNPDGTFAPDKLVTRAEFAAIITRALGIPDSALAGYATTTFKDTVGYGWAIKYLAFCQAKGIMIGDGQGNAMPGRTITVNEAMTMILRAIGYVDNSAELVGKWPANYVTLAKAVKLYDDIADNAQMTRENAAIAIYNALTVQLVSVNTDGKTDKRWYDEEDDVWATLLNTGLNCTAEKEVICSYEAYDDSLINIAKKLGAYGTAYTNDDDQLVAFSVDSTFLTGTIDGSKFKVGDKKYSMDQTHSAIFFWNAEEVDDSGDVDKDALAKFAEDNADGEDLTIAAKVSGSTIKEIYSVVAWEATDAEMIDQGSIDAIEEDQELFNGAFVLDDDDAIDQRQFALVGVKGLEDIAVDDVVYVYANSDDDIRMVAVGQEVVEGTIDETSDDDFVIDGKTYEFSADYLILGAGAVAADAAAGDDAVVALDAYGFAFDIDADGGDPGMFGYIMAANDGNVSAPRAEIYNSDDAQKYYDFVSLKNIKVDGSKSATTKVTDYEDEFVGIKLNADGDISGIETGAKDTLKVRSSKILQAGSDSFSIASNVVVMTYSSQSGIVFDDFGVSSIDNVEFGKAATGWYVLDSKGEKVIGMLLSDEIADKASDDVYGVLNAVNTAKSGDDDITRITALIDGTSTRLDTIVDPANDVDADDLKVVNLYKFTKNGEGKVKNVVAYQTPGGMLVQDETAAATGAWSASDLTIKLANGDKYPVESGVIIYKATEKSGKYTYEKVSSVKNGSQVWIYDTKDDDDKDEIGTVVIFEEN